MRGMLDARMAVLVLVLLVACKGRPDSTPWCSAEAEGALAVDAPAAADAGLPEADITPTWHRDVKPIVEGRCQRCHVEGGLGGFSLTTWDDVYRRGDSVRRAVVSRHMPPWHAARCCTTYHEDSSLTPEELGAFVRWIDSGMLIGDARESPRTVAKVGGLSRVDVTLAMPAPYVPAPPEGSTDDTRCFLLPWPLDRAAFVTGVNPVPGNRSVVHHLMVASVHGDSLDAARERDGKDGRPGFDCRSMDGLSLGDMTVLGGGLIGTDHPGGVGLRVEPGATVMLQMHYSTASAPPKADLTKVELRVDANAIEYKGLVVTNAAWMVGDAMRIRAGDPDAVFWYRYEPSVFTGGKRVLLRSVTPHMHAFGSKVVVRIVKDDGRRECLLEIPEWHFGWEQPFWFAEPHVLEPGDELYVECHFDNSLQNQKGGHAPRDIAWGGDNQDMCAAFVNFTEAP